jgi:ATP-dependent Lhr-like helicase
LIKKSYPFKNLELKDFMDVLNQVQEERTKWVDGNEFGKKRSSFSYFYDNISMIPDEKNYKVIDAATRNVIGTLDEKFVASYIQPHARLIIKGCPWEVVDIEEDGILLSPAKVLGAVPNWVGEEIPVPYAVAQEVGKIRRTVELESYPARPKTKAIIEDHLQKQSKKFPVPTDKLITIEHDKKIMIVNACFGSKVNETLGQLITTLLAARIGESIGVRTDPYRIILELPTVIEPKLVGDILISTNPKGLESLLKTSIKNSSYMRYVFINVARKFCAMQKDADYRQVSIGRIMEAFSDTPLYNETIEKILWEKMDVPLTKEILRKIQNGTIRIEITGLSPIGLEGLDVFKALTSPQKPDRLILMTLKKRIEGEKVKLICLKCKKSFTKRVGSLPQKITCPVCDAKLVAAVHPYEDVLPLLKKKKPTKSEQKKIQALYKSANLIMRHGKKAVLALRARGVGPGGAARILSGYYETEEEFLRELFSAELQYARTRRFW